MGLGSTSSVLRLPVRAIRPDWLQPHECVALAYFSALALWAFTRSQGPGAFLFLAACSAFLLLLCRMESRASRPWSRIVREWVPLGLILVAYWSLDLFRHARPSGWEPALLALDHQILSTFGLRSLIESLGAAVPAVLEAIYLLLYAIPAACLFLVYWKGGHSSVRRFLLVLFLGTLAAYALIPLFPLSSPCFTHPQADPPSFSTLPRTINLWLLRHADISTGVFPSGHVAVAFSCAFGLLSALPRRRTLWSGAFLAAVLVYAATVYGRYHYAVDGLASLCIATAAWRVAERWQSRVA